MSRIDAASRTPSLPNLLQSGDSEREPETLRSWCTNGTSRIEFRSTNYIERGALRYKPEGRGVRSSMVSLEFFMNIILPSSLWPWGRLSL